MLGATIVNRNECMHVLNPSNLIKKFYTTNAARLGHIYARRNPVRRSVLSTN